MAQEVVEKELKELPEGYILYIVRVRRPKGLGTLSTRTTPGSAGSTAVSEGEEIRIKLIKVGVSFASSPSLSLSIDSSIPKIKCNPPEAD